MSGPFSLSRERTESGSGWKSGKLLCNLSEPSLMPIGIVIYEILQRKVLHKIKSWD